MCLNYKPQFVWSTGTCKGCMVNGVTFIEKYSHFCNFLAFILGSTWLTPCKHCCREGTWPTQVLEIKLALDIWVVRWETTWTTF